MPMSRIAVRHVDTFGQHCEGCANGKHTPFYWLGDQVEADWTGTQAAEGWAGLVHGSVIATLHDEAAAWTMMIVLARTGFTSRLDIRYLRPLRVGDRALVRGRVVEQDDHKATFATEIVLPNGKPASTGTVEYAFMEDPALFEKMLGRPVGAEFLTWLRANADGRRAMNVREGELASR